MNVRHRESRILAGIGLLLAALLPSGAQAGIVSCAGFDSGGNSCEVCAVDRSYLGSDFTAWDWFHNDIPGNPEVVFSGLQSNAFVDTMGNLATNQNGLTTTTKPVSHYMPQGYLNPVGQPDIVAFLLQGLKFVNHPTSRNDVAARIVYDLRYGVPAIDGTTGAATINWAYTEGVESTVGGAPHLSANAVYSGVSTKNISVTRSHRECHNLYVSWCGDGVPDAGESCDAGSQNGVPGSGCSVTCETVSAGLCVPGPTVGARPSAIDASTPGLCATGPVTGFSESGRDASGNISYAWGCGGSAVGGACSASYNSTTPPGTCVPGPTTGVRPDVIESTTPGLCSTGDAQGFVATYDAATKTVHYSWGCAGSAVGGSCTASYNLVVGGTCLAGPVTGPQTALVNASNPGLCRFGAAENFTANYDPVTNAVSYSWGCAGSAVGGSCTASYGFIVDGMCVPGATVGPQPSSIDGSNGGLCAFGTAENFSAVGPDGSGTTHYTWGCNRSAVGGACSASYNSTTPPGTCVPGPTTGVQPNQLNAATSGLCPVGVTVNNFTPTPGGGTLTNYSWGCGGSSVGGACTASYDSTTPPGSSCQPGGVSASVASPLSSSSPGLCAAGPAAVHDFAATAADSSGNVYYTWACGSSMAGGLCAANRNSSGGGGWPPGGGGGYCGDGYLGVGESCEPYRWSIVGGVSTLVPNTASPNCRSDCTYCGDATLQTNHGEECDSALPGCNASCTLSTFTNPGQYPGDLNMTNPGGYASKLANFRVIVGDGVSVFSDGTSITFDRSYPFYIDGASGRQVCLRDNDSAIKGDNTAYCKPIAMAAPDTSLTLLTGSDPGVKRFVGNTNAIGAAGYEDTSNSSFFVELGYLQEPIKTRVAKSAVANTAGGGGYLERSAGYDVGYLNFDPAGASAARFIASIQAGNFTTVSLRATDLGTEKNLSSLSYAATADSSTKAHIDSAAATSGDSLSRSARAAAVSAVPSGTSISSESDFDVLLPAFRDQSDIRVQKYGDLSLGNLHLTGVRTIIVEDGDLRINGNIDQSAGASYAFVVKNGNIVVDSSVTSISGIFIVSNGSLLGTTRTTERLRIDGSVYGNIEPLLETRTYVRGEAGYEALSVGVIVNYSNRILTNPPPLVK
jgi:hypothetical protein